MNPKTIVVLLVVLALAAGGVGLWKAGVFEPDEPEAADRSLTPAFADVRTLTVTDAAGQTMTFQRVAGTNDWTGPFPRLVQWKVGALARAVAGLEYVRRFDPGSAEGIPDDLTGLDAPPWTVTILAADGTSTVFHVGRRTMAGSATPETYIRPTGQTDTFVVARDLPGALSQDLSEFRDLTVLNVPRGRVDRIAIDGPIDYTLAKVGGAWRLAEPVDAAADSDAVDAVLDKLNHILADRVLAERDAADLMAFGLDQPMLTATIHLAPEAPAATQPGSAPAGRPAVELAGETHVLAIGQRRGAAVTARVDDGEVVSLPATFVEALQPALADLRSKKLLDMAAKDITSIVITKMLRAREGGLLLSDGSEIRILRGDDGNWSLKAKEFRDDIADSAMSGIYTATIDAPPADAVAVALLLDQLTQVRAKAWLSELTPEVAGFGVLRESTAITVRVGEKETTLQLGPVREDDQLVRVGSSIVRVAKDAFAGIGTELRDYWPREMYRVPDGQDLTELYVDRPDGEWVLRKGEAGWEAVQPADAKVDPVAVRKLARALQSVVCQEIVQIGTLSDLPDHSPVVVIVPVTTSTGATTQPAVVAGRPAKWPTDPEDPSEGTLVFAMTGNGGLIWRHGQAPLVVGKVSKELTDIVSASLVAAPTTQPADGEQDAPASQPAGEGE